MKRIIFYLGLAAATSVVSCMKMDMAEEPALTIVEGGFMTPLSMPNYAETKDLILDAKTATSTTMLTGKTTTGAAFYNGGFPVLRANSGDAVRVKLQNGLSEASNIHFHGLLTPANMDGHPKDVAAAGGAFNYAFRVNQRAATTWFHPHPDMKTGSQVYKGLAGMFIVNDAEEAALKLPSSYPPLTRQWV